ncbi:general transcription factor IIH subunit 2 isoform X1 [Aphelocoma coerulescens]|uniref:general transcription factor IIH subunit 2 isoform X1 n=1 Tax=Aphelocoma coerulescens TaxID=39617 RepID=UPI0036052E50
MDDEPERTKRWEGGYERTWEILKEDESGSLKATIEDILFKAKRKRLYEHHGQVRLGMMRHLYVVVDGSRTMEDQDLKPNRLTCTLKLLEYFVEEYFDQNPISQIGLIVTKSKRAEKMTELSGNSKKHVTALKKAVDMNCSGEPSLYNSLNLAMQTLKHMPGHTSREVLVVLSSLTTCDPANIYDLIKCLKAVKIRVSVIGLSAEVRVCTVLARETGGTYHVILDESHYKELLMHHVSPPPASSSSECSLIRMGFPQHTIASLSDQDAKPSFSMAQLENNSDPGLTLGGYFCPQCRAKYCELPVECKICAGESAPDTHTLPTGEMGERIRSVKVRKLMDDVKGNLIVTAKAVHASRAKSYISVCTSPGSVVPSLVSFRCLSGSSAGRIQGGTVLSRLPGRNKRSKCVHMQSVSECILCGVRSVCS